MAEYKLAGMDISEEELDLKLHLYLKSYQPAGEADLFVPSVIFAKNKGVLPCHFTRWDRHAYRYQFLEKVGITLPTKPAFENQPPSVVETMRSLEDESFEEELAKMRAERKQARIGFQEFLARQKKADTTKK